jgi:murein L,D-transpeptidase YcbB/YkuD
VNIPAFELIAYGRERSRRFRVIVGRPSWPSPLLREQIESLVANPDWHVPESIARAEIIPRLRENPALVHEEGFEIYDGWGSDAVRLDVAEIHWLNTLREGGQLPHIVQRTGPYNPLGRLKMVFPNQGNVHLHDTSAPGLFEKTSRALSHGCIRVEDPLGIVEVLMGRAAAEQTQRAVATGRRKDFQLLEKIPIEIIYLTAWAREDGTVEFYGDVYNQDPSLAGLLRTDAGARPAERPS